MYFPYRKVQKLRSVKDDSKMTVLLFCVISVIKALNGKGPGP